MKKFYYNSRWGGVKNHKTSAGFTLIEMVVSIFALGVVLTIVSAVFAQSLSFQRRALNAQRVEENLNVVMEAITREVRVATITTPNTSCPGTFSNTLAIQHPTNGTVTYSLVGNAIHRNVAGVDSTMSSNTVEFTRLQFCITGNSPGTQPRVTVLSTVQSTDVNQRIKEDHQTTLSIRFLNQ